MIPDKTKSINSYAFCDCTALKNLTIGKNLESIGEGVFYDCTALEKINWHAVKVFDFGTYNYVFAYAGVNGNGIEIVFYDSVEYIPRYVHHSKNHLHYRRYLWNY